MQIALVTRSSACVVTPVARGRGWPTRQLLERAAG
jgi:hypothetical protein